MIATAQPGRVSPGCEIHEQVTCEPLPLLLVDMNQEGFRMGGMLPCMISQPVNPDLSFISLWILLSGSILILLVTLGSVV